MYRFSNVPRTLQDIPRFLSQELQRIAQSINKPLAASRQEFENRDSAVNRVGKEPGLFVWDQTYERPVWSTGHLPDDPWKDAAGTIAHTPTDKNPP